MKNHLKRVLVLTVVCFFAINFASCATQRFTKYVVDEIGNENVTNFQYYLAKTVTLIRIASSSGSNVQGGVGRVSSLTIRDKIIIPSSTPGIATRFDGDDIDISFEEGHSDIKFHLYNSSDDYYDYDYLMANSHSTIWYDGEEYQVKYIGFGAPKLLIQLTRDSSTKSQSRTIQGRRIK